MKESITVNQKIQGRRATNLLQGFMTMFGNRGL